MAYRALAQELSPLKARCKAGLLLFYPRLASAEAHALATVQFCCITVRSSSERLAASHSGAV